MDETEHLLSSPVNAKRLMAAVEQVRGDQEIFDPTMALRWRINPAAPNDPPVLERGWLSRTSNKVLWKKIGTVVAEADQDPATSQREGFV